MVGGSVDKKYLHQMSIRNHHHMSKMSPGTAGHATIISMENRYVDVPFLLSPLQLKRGEKYLDFLFGSQLTKTTNQKLLLKDPNMLQFAQFFHQPPGIYVAKQINYLCPSCGKNYNSNISWDYLGCRGASCGLQYGAVQRPVTHAHSAIVQPLRE